MRKVASDIRRGKRTLKKKNHDSTETACEKEKKKREKRTKLRIDRLEAFLESHISRVGDMKNVSWRILLGHRAILNLCK